MGRNPTRGLALALLAVAVPVRADADPGARVAVEERVGARLPPQVVLRDDGGANVRFGDLAVRPLLLTFVYHGCSRRCPLLLGGLAEALGQVRLRPGEDYAVAAVSIDESDTPASAAAAKRNYLAAVGGPFPPSAWRFLTGDRAAVAGLAAAAGVAFAREGEHIFHPSVLLAVAPGGVIAGYLPVELDRAAVRSRIDFGPGELQAALEAAARGEAAAARPHQALFCLPYERDPERRFLGLLRAAGAATLLALGGVLAFVLRGRRPARGPTEASR